MAQISLRDIDFSYDEREKIFSQFSLEIREGDFVSIVGPSGTGKSTLLEIMALLVSPDSGAVFFDNIEKTVSDCGTQSVAYIDQTNAICPWASVLENVLLPLKCKAKVSKADRERAISALNALGIGEYRDRFPGQLSGGQHQRVSLAQVLFTKPDVVLLDEPTARLDFQTRILLESIFLEVLRNSADRSTNVMVTHDIETALVLSDRVICVGRREDRAAEIVFDERINLNVETRLPEHARDSSAFRKMFREIWHCLKPFANFGQTCGVVR